MICGGLSLNLPVSGWANHRQNSAVLQSAHVKLVEQQRHADVGQLSSMLTRGRRLASELQTVQWVMPHKLHSLYVFVGMTPINGSILVEEEASLPTLVRPR